jgi:peptidase E
VADGNIALEMAQGVLVKYVGDHSHISIAQDVLAVGGGNTGTFLTTMLKSE